MPPQAPAGEGGSGGEDGAAAAAAAGSSDRDPETFDDAEFYQTLLKEFLEGSGAAGGGGNYLSVGAEPGFGLPTQSCVSDGFRPGAVGPTTSRWGWPGQAALVACAFGQRTMRKLQGVGALLVKCIH